MERAALSWAARRDRHHPVARPRSIRATAALFALGAVLTLADALQTQWLLRDHRFSERWTPIHFLVERLGTDLALGLASLLAIATMGLLAAGAVYSRRPIANAAFTVLAMAVVVRAFGCANNFGLIVK